MPEYPKLIDLHIHSTASDGTDTAAELLEKVRSKGIELFSVTDHDAVTSALEMPDLLRGDDPAFISGVEFSCRDKNGRYHILGYGYDPKNTDITGIVTKAHNYRMNKITGRLSFLESSFGMTFPPDEVERLLRRENPGKPHIGNLMVKYGYAETKDQAISEFINKAESIGEYVGPEEAIGSILSGGGIPVLAHPAFGSGSQYITGDELDNRVKRLMEMGLQGVEAFYSGFTPELIGEALRLAKKYDLYVTAGSDYHGTNKTITLGHTNLPAPSDYPDGLKRLIALALLAN